MATASASASSPGRNILVAVDYTDESVRTVEWALQQHARPGDRLTLLHVEPHHTPAARSLPGPGPFAALWEREQEQCRLREQQEKAVGARIAAWAAEHAPQQGVQVVCATAQVEPQAAVADEAVTARHAILSEVDRRHVDTLILGSHRSAVGVGQLSSSLPKSFMMMVGGARTTTSQYCAQRASCPVIVVPPAAAAEAPVRPVACSTAAQQSAAMPAFLDSLAL